AFSSPSYTVIGYSARAIPATCFQFMISNSVGNTGWAWQQQPCMVPKPGSRPISASEQPLQCIGAPANLRLAEVLGRFHCNRPRVCPFTGSKTFLHLLVK